MDWSDSVYWIAFWWLSIAGSVILLIYAIHRADPIFVLAYLPNAFVYTRNLVLVRRDRRQAAEPAPSFHDGNKPLDPRSRR